MNSLCFVENENEFLVVRAGGFAMKIREPWEKIKTFILQEKSVCFLKQIKYYKSPPQTWNFTWKK